MPECIGRHVDLRAMLPLVAVVSRTSSALGRGWKRLAAQDHRRGVLRQLRVQARQHAQVVHDLLEHGHTEPTLRSLVDGGPGRQVVGHHAPRRTGAHTM